jgi:hypothetical protein
MNENQNFARYFQGLYNISGFDGTIESDFLKLGNVPDDRKSDLIDYNINGFDEYRTALQNYLSSVYPTDYNNFASSDLGQMMVEMFAYMAAVLALRTDMTANEMYIDTVKNEDNLQRLLQLIGVSMKGPTASKATGLLELPAGTSPSFPVTIAQSQRQLNVVNERNNIPLSYTITKQLSNGTLDLFSKDLSLTAPDFNGANYASGLVLVEGALTTAQGTFRGGLDQRQTFTITDGPVIEGSIGVSSTESGTGGTGGTLYNEIQSLYLASGGSQPVFEKTYTGGFGCVLTFGDGVRGKLPTPGTSFVVSYRTGGGANGNVARETVNQNIQVLQGGVTPIQATIKNTTKGSGGNPPESVAHAKRYAPYFFRTQYRAVTGEDYNALANSFVGTAGTTAKCMATVRKNGAAANVIDLFVLSKASETQLERASVAMKKELLDYFSNYKMLTDDIVISDGVVRTLDIVSTIFIDKANARFSDSIKQKAADKLLEFFNVDNLGFGQKISISDIQNAMLTVPEIRFFNVNNLPEDIYVNFNEIVQLNNFEFSVELV